MTRGLEPRLALLQGLQFAIPGAWLPSFYSLLIGERGFTVGQTGYALAATAVGSLVAPFYVGHLADRVLRADRLLAVLHLMGAVLFGLLARASSPGPVIGLCLGVGLVYAPTIGLANTVCLAHLASRQRLGPVRMWGTVGWVLSGLVVAQWLLHVHTPLGVSEQVVRAAQDAGRVDALWLASGLAAALGLYCLLLPSTPPAPGVAGFAPRQALACFTRQPLATLVLAALLLACVDRFYMLIGAEFLSRFGRGDPGLLERLAGVGGTGLMSLGQVTEIALLGAFPLLAARLSLRSMLITAAATYALRMALFAWADGLPLILLAVALHGLCFTFFFFAGFLVVDEVCPPSLRASGQALFQLVFGGLGGVLGSLIVGRVGAWAARGEGVEPARLFLPPLLMALAATAVLVVAFPRARSS